MDTISVLGIVNAAPFCFGAILVCLTCLVWMVLHRRFEKVQSKLLLAIIVVLIVNSAGDMVGAALRDYMVESGVARACVLVADYLYYVVHTMLAPMVCVYFFAVCGMSTKRNTLSDKLLAAPFVVVELIAVTNPLTRWVYYYGANTEFTRSWGAYAIYVVSLFYIFLGIYRLMRSWRALTPVKRRAIAYFFIMACIGLVVQLIEPKMLIELFAESVGILGIMLFVESEDEMIDSETGLYNRQALKMDLNAYTKQKRPFYLVAVRVSNADTFNRLGGTVLSATMLATTLSDYFKSIEPWYHVYRAAPMRFVLTYLDLDKQRAADLADSIAHRFETSWDIAGIDVGLHAIVALACVPDDLPTSADVLYLVDAPVPQVASGHVLQGDDLNYLLRRAEVERAVQRGFEEGNYEVYYQPVMNADGTVHSAEALMRLTDNELGSVPPFEFIEVAERMALVDDIGEIALRQVCSFLQSGQPQQMGVNNINVNLSVVECMQDGFVERVNGIIAEYDVDPRMIGFEITESVASGDYSFLDRVMGELRSKGHRFSMDDYGTGYSNMHSLLTLNFDVVKIDKSVLWDAEKSETGKAVLETSVNLLNSVGCKVLAEGVETASQVQTLGCLHVDYYQGFYYAKPMPKSDFLCYLERYQV